MSRKYSVKSLFYLDLIKRSASCKNPGIWFQVHGVEADTCDKD